MRVALFTIDFGSGQFQVSAPFDVPDGTQEYVHRSRIVGMSSGSTGDGWGIVPSWVYVLTDEVRQIGGEAVRVMRQERMQVRVATQ